MVPKNFKREYVAKGDSVYNIKSGEVMKYGDLEVDDKNSFYLGRHIMRNGDRPQKIYRAQDPMSQFYNFNKPLFDECEVFVDKSVTMSGCFKSNKVTLQRTMIPDIECMTSGLPTMKTVKVFDKAITNAVRKLKICQLGKCYSDDMFLSSFNAKTYPGFHLNQYSRHKTKSEACEDALLVAMERWKVIDKCAKNKRPIKRNKIFPSTYAVGARNKRDFSFIDDDVLSSRAVHMPEFYSEMNSAVWIEQINHHIKEKGHGPLYVGNSFVKYNRLKKDLGDSKVVLEGDWKRFDSRLYITNIIIGLSILRCYYDIEDENIDKHFIAMFDTIGIKDYYTPGGYIYRLIHGLPSGVCSTSLLGSVINLVNLLYCCGDLPLKRVKFIVGGDDFLIAVDNSISDKVSLDKIQERAVEIGQVFKFLDIKNQFSENIFDRPCFFKYTIDRGEPVVFPSSLLERTFLPWNKRYNSNLKIYRFLRDLIPSLAAPRSFHLPFYYFYKEIYYRTFSREIALEEIYLDHLHIYNKVMDGKVFYAEGKQIQYKTLDYDIERFNALKRKRHKLFLLNKKIKVKVLKISERK